MAAKPMNKFAKSVLEQKQKEQEKPIQNSELFSDQQQPSTPSHKSVDDDAQPVYPISSIEDQPALPKISTKKPAPSAENTPTETFSLDQFLTPEQGRQAKNKTFYLDASVIDAIKKAARANHIAESKLVNDILKKVLQV